MTHVSPKILLSDTVYCNLVSLFKFRRKDLVKTMRRVDPVYLSLAERLGESCGKLLTDDLNWIHFFSVNMFSFINLFLKVKLCSFNLLNGLFVLQRSALNPPLPPLLPLLHLSSTDDVNQNNSPETRSCETPSDKRTS